MKRVRIYDMDGVLVDSSHRFATLPNGKIDLTYWTDNRHRCFDDSPLPLLAQYQADCDDVATFCIIATARVMHEEEARHLQEVIGLPNYFISREAGDKRKGAEMKLAGIRKILALKQFAHIQDVLVYEDNPDYLTGICNALRCNGVYVPSNQGV